jgi:hypothetical protein
MSHEWSSNDKEQTVAYKWKDKTWQEITVKSGLEGQPVKVGSEEEFITEHYWGYTKINEQKTFEYEVTHPTWKVYPVEEYQVKIDFGAVYGGDFEVLNRIEPTSVMLAEGSIITVEKVNKIS